MLVPVNDLVGNPGETRDLHRDVAVEEVGDDPWGPAEGVLVGPLRLDLVLDAVVEGVWVHGGVRWGLDMACSRCLEDVHLARHAEVGELFADPRRLEHDEEVDEGYVLVEDATAIDLERMLHDAVVLDVPTTVRCDRDDCVPPVGDGIEVLDEDEAHARAEAAPDPRWAALADLELD